MKNYSIYFNDIGKSAFHENREIEYKSKMLTALKNSNIKKDFFKWDGDIPVPTKIDYDENDFVEYEIQYKFEEFKIICSKFYFNNRQMEIYNNSFCNANETYMMLNACSIDFDTKFNINFNYKQMVEDSDILIPEKIDNTRFVYHKMNDFLAFNFNDYFKSKSNLFLIDENLEILCGIFKKYNKKQLVKKLTTNPTELALYLFDKKTKKSNYYGKNII